MRHTEKHTEMIALIAIGSPLVAGAIYIAALYIYYSLV